MDFGRLFHDWDPSPVMSSFEASLDERFVDLVTKANQFADAMNLCGRSVDLPPIEGPVTRLIAIQHYRTCCSTFSSAFNLCGWDDEFSRAGLEPALLAWTAEIHTDLAKWPELSAPYLACQL